MPITASSTDHANCAGKQAVPAIIWTWLLQMHKRLCSRCQRPKFALSAAISRRRGGDSCPRVRFLQIDTCGVLHNHRPPTTHFEYWRHTCPGDTLPNIAPHNITRAVHSSGMSQTDYHFTEEAISPAYCPPNAVIGHCQSGSHCPHYYMVWQR
ncbi:hypothetical protein BDZ89DRAFT_220140 [Hymenopellis radicata]|nr:hypothetical protein BDZ89DRAFT_220140 [Hymenopellis radicata]